MPATRRSSANHTAAGKQSKLSFAHRVIKPASGSAGKKELTTSPLVKELCPEPRAEQVPEVEEETPAIAEPVRENTEAQVRAEAITTTQINKYWRGVEAQRIAPRVHQEDLEVGEKVLRYFDVSSQYGPCIGSSRLRRWLRADRLGLNPPIEVLAVLVREEANGNRDFERAHMDEIMNSTAVGAL